jgi:hypothetical protein
LILRQYRGHLFLAWGFKKVGGVNAAVYQRGGAQLAQGQQQTTGQGPVAMAFSRAVFRVIDLRRRSSASGRAAWGGKDGATPQTPRSRERQVKA